MHSLWLKVALVPAAVWLIAGGVIFWARNAKPTPERLQRYLDSHRIENASGASRGNIMEQVADQLNGLAYEDRRELRMGKKLDGFFRSLTPAEQARFLDLTLPTGFKQMMESLNKMEPAKRKQVVDRAVRDMRERAGERPPDAELDANARKMIDQGFKSFYTDASADVKMDVAPLIEEMQKNLQGLR